MAKTCAKCTRLSCLLMSKSLGCIIVFSNATHCATDSPLGTSDAAQGYVMCVLSPASKKPIAAATPTLTQTFCIYFICSLHHPAKKLPKTISAFAELGAIYSKILAKQVFFFYAFYVLTMPTNNISNNTRYYIKNRKPRSNYEWRYL